VRIWRIVRKRECLKFIVFNTRQWCEAHPLRQTLETPETLDPPDSFQPTLVEPSLAPGIIATGAGEEPSHRTVMLDMAY